MTKGFLCVLDALAHANELAETSEDYLTGASASYRKAGISYRGDASEDLRRQIVAEHRPRSFPLPLPIANPAGGRFEIRFESGTVVRETLPLHLWKRMIGGRRFAFSTAAEPYDRIFARPCNDRIIDPEKRKWPSCTVGWRFSGGLAGHLWIGDDRIEYWSGRPIDVLVERFDGLPLSRT
jgi:hypothetical protein